ncbi:MAG TPA: family 78 glycoside hydrolase catalytic domain [Candidatus Hydrogenedentes bacterium]|nr:family 78 glycoside hydrolase catalytic domain [Candidatus Hydrogenedentota bacterium]
MPTSEIVPTELRCEYLVDPLGIDVSRPRLSWVLRAERRRESQTAYHVLVASEVTLLDSGDVDLWDSGKVESDQSIHVAYQGNQLRSNMHCFWRVRVWNFDGIPSSWSKTAFWTMGLLYSEDWRAKWIRGKDKNCDDGAATGSDQLTQTVPSPLFRKMFQVSRTPKAAQLHVCGLGWHELWLNGKRVGSHVLDPAFTRYDKRVLYVTHEVADMLKRGKNALGVMLGNGWYNMHTRALWDFDKAPWRATPCVRVELDIVFEDDSTESIVTDETWKTSRGPIVFDSVRNGEVYDARLEKPGWDTPEYVDADWPAAEIVCGPKGRLVSQRMPPIEVVATIVPVKLTQPKPGVFVFDLGQNIAGWARLEAEGPAGTTITIRHSEALDANGMIDPSEKGYVYSGDFQMDQYVLKGQGTEIWEPRFTYHGFQYVQIEGFPGTPALNALRGRAVHTAFERAGSFECSNTLLNKINHCAQWSYLNNFMGYPTDCPTREKNGWTGDGHLATELGLYNFRSVPAYVKWANDLADEQREDGELPGIVPSSGWGYDMTGPAWASACVLIPWTVYVFCGDTRILDEHYDLMKRYLDYLGAKADRHIVSYPEALGDWAPLGFDGKNYRTPPELTSTGYYFADCVIVSRIAQLLGETNEAARYAALAEEVKAAFSREFFDLETATYANGSQTALACALYHGLVPEEEKRRVLEGLVKEVERHDGHLDCGILGTKYLLHALADNGRPDIAYKVATQRTLPSWGWWVDHGATTLWEFWDARAGNHVMYGDIGAWFYKVLAGIRPDPDTPGFKHTVIRPCPVGDLEWVNAEHVSMYGRICSSWRLTDAGFSLEVEIPHNTTATVFIPAPTASRVTENGVPAAESEGVALLGIENGSAAFSVGSGHYHFLVGH